MSKIMRELYAEAREAASRERKRYSVFKGDRVGMRNYELARISGDIEVRCDGELVKDAMVADELAGELVCIERPLRVVDGEFATYVRRGNVEVRIVPRKAAA